MTITALPTPPQTSDPTNFDTRADSFLAALPVFVTEANAQAVSVNADKIASAQSVEDAAAQASLATTQATNAAISATSVSETANVVKWVSGTNYTEGVNTWSPITFFTYRRKVTGDGTTDPSLDLVNWAIVTPNVAEVPLGSLIAFDSSKSENLITVGTANYLKTGVIADATSYPLVDSAGWFSSSLATLDAGMVAQSSIAAGNGVWIAVAQGFARVSTDGVGFGTPIALTGFGVALQSIAFANGIFVILDSANAVCATTTNGTTFTYGTLPSARSWSIPAYGNGIWLSVSNGTFAMTSNDGLSWTARTNSLSLPVVAMNQLAPIAFGAGLFVVISQDASGSFSTTADGITWVSRSQTVPTTRLVNIIFANSLFVVRANQAASSGTVRTSTDGITFTNRSVTMTTREVDTPVYYHNGGYLIQEGILDTFRSSTDAITWSIVVTTSPDLLALCPLVVVSGTQALAMSSEGKLARSDTAGYWGAINIGYVVSSTVCLSAANGRFMYNLPSGGNNNAAAMTTDGINWWRIHGQGILGTTSISYNAGLYIAASNVTGFYTSPDLSTWTSRTGLLAVSNTLLVVNGITFSISPQNGNHVNYVYSTDNITFTAGVLPTSANWNGIAFGNSTYLATSTTTAAASSATGLVGSWTARTLPIIPVGCVFANGFFIIASSTGVFYKSSDCITWEIIPTSSFNQGAGVTLKGLFVLGTSVFGFTTTSRVLVWSGGSTVITRTITFTPPERFAVASDGSKVVGLVGTTTQYNGVAATDKVLNDVNLKTYHATAADQTNFYKRVS